MPIFVHAADIHLDSPLRGLVQDDSFPEIDEVRGATRKALNNLVTLCLDKRIPLLVIAGDLYDGDWQDFSTGLYFVQQMQRLAAANIKVAIIRGNHDAANKMTKALVLPENVKIFSSEEPETWLLEDLNIALHGQSYAKPAETRNLVLSYPPPTEGFFNIGLHHCLISGTSGHQPYAPCSINDLVTKGYDYWALGHVHTHQVLHESPYIVYPGCSQGRHIKETGAKGCTVVSGSREELTIDFHPLDTVRWQEVTVDVGKAATMGEVYSRITENLSAMGADEQYIHCLRLNLIGTTEIHNELLAESDGLLANTQALAYDAFAGRCMIQKVNIKTAQNIDLALLTGSDTPQGELLRFIQNLDIESLQEDLGIDLTPLQAKIGACGLKAEIQENILDNVRDLLLHELSNLQKEKF